MPKIKSGTVAEHRRLSWLALANAMEALLAERAFDAITLAAIATQTGMARNTIYNYAPDKASLLARVTERLSEMLLMQIGDIAAGPGPAGQRLAEIIDAILGWFGAGEHRRLVAQSLFGAVPDAERDRAAAPLVLILRDVRKVIDDGVAAGEFRVLDRPDLTLNLMAGVMQAAVTGLLRFPGNSAPEDLADTQREVLALILPGLKVHPGG